MPKKKKKNKSRETVDQTASKDRQEASRNEQVMAASSPNIYNVFNTSIINCTGVLVGDQTTIHNNRKAKRRAHHSKYADSQKLMANPSTSQKEEPWQTVCNKRKTKHTQSITTSHDSGETFKIETFINTPPSTNVIFVENEKTYFENPFQFSLDIVSMWNTPHRMLTIILGIKANPSLPNSVIGLIDPLSHQQLQDLFQADHFQTKPEYTYNEISYRDKQIGVISINSSAGQGHPCLTTLDYDGISNFKADQLWYRKNGENVICKHSDATTVHINNWFRGSKHTTLRTRQEPEEQQPFQVSNNSKFTTDITLQLDSFGQGNAILVSGKVPSSTKNIGALMKIPWLYVFDFDITSRESGLLAACLKQRTNRSLHITYWDHLTDISISDQATIWCFLEGSKDRPDSIVSEDHRKWKRDTKSGIEQHCRDLAQFAKDTAVLNVLVLWPDLNFSHRQMSSFLQRLDEFLETSPCITFCFQEKPDNHVVESAFSHLCNELRVTTVRISPEKLCFEIETPPHLTGQSNVDQLQLACNTEESVNISKKDYDWLNEDMYVLFRRTPLKKPVPLKNTEEALEAFFKGGTAHWSTWYECGTGYFDIQRNLMESILKRIRTQCLNHSKSLITLLHAPGSGGTTLAQRILWELHLITPCVQVKSYLGSTLEQLVSKIDFLYQQTNSCIVILFDGEDEERVNMLFNKLCNISFVILYVKRHRRREAMERENRSRMTYWLYDEVSYDESKRLTLKLLDTADTTTTPLQNPPSASSQTTTVSSMAEQTAALHPLANSDKLEKLIVSLDHKLSTNFDNLNDSIESLRSDEQQTKTRLQHVEKKVENDEQLLNNMHQKNSGQVTQLNAKIAELEREIVLKDIHERKRNLLFYGIKYDDKTEITTDKTEEILRHFMTEDLKVDGDLTRDMQLAAVHRHGKPRRQVSDAAAATSSMGDTPPGITAVFVKMKDRDLILKSSNKLAGTRKSILVDLPPHLKTKRSKLATTAYRLRKENGLHTRIRVVDVDVILEVRKPGAHVWSPYKE